MKITLCGSTRFAERFRTVNDHLSRQGHIVYALGVMPPREDLTPREKEILDLVHLQKIAESDAVFWVHDNISYYGESTRRELTWAKMLGKLIFEDEWRVPSSLLSYPILGEDSMSEGVQREDDEVEIPF